MCFICACMDVTTQLELCLHEQNPVYVGLTSSLVKCPPGLMDIYTPLPSAIQQWNSFTLQRCIISSDFKKHLIKKQCN